MSDLTPEEVPIPGYEHLVHRPSSWRKQPFFKGRTIWLTHVIRAIARNGDELTPEEVMKDLGLPMEALPEALRWCKDNLHVIEQDSFEEGRRVATYQAQRARGQEG